MPKKTYNTGIGTHSTKEEREGYALLEHLALQKRNAIRRLEILKYEVNHEDFYRSKNENYLTPLERGEITALEYEKLKK